MDDGVGCGDGAFFLIREVDEMSGERNGFDKIRREEETVQWMLR
jgi:hypothetical protein